MIVFIINFLLFFLLCDQAFAIGSIVASAMLLSGWQAAVVAFAINMVASSIISKVFAPSLPNQPDLPPPAEAQVGAPAPFEVRA